MEISIIQIGNSKGIRFSKTMIEKYNLRDKVDLILEKDQIVIKPLTSRRKGWEKAFKEMSEQGDDRLLFKDVFDDENPEDGNK
jgi:antitoxin MazE